MKKYKYGTSNYVIEFSDKEFERAEVVRNARMKDYVNKKIKILQAEIALLKEYFL